MTENRTFFNLKLEAPQELTIYVFYRVLQSFKTEAPRIVCRFSTFKLKAPMFMAAHNVIFG